MSIHESIAVRREPPDTASSPLGGDWVWVFAGLALTMGLIAVWLRWRMGASSDRVERRSPSGLWSKVLKRNASAPTLVSTVRLTSTQSLHEVDWQGRKLLIGCTTGSLVVLGEVPLASSEVSSLSEPAAGDSP